MIKLIQHENIPCWYELSWRDKEKSLVLSVHRDFINNEGNIKSDAPIVAHFMEEFGFKSFSGDFSSDFFGFDQSLKRIGECSEFVDFLAKIPATERKTGKKCEYCHGSGKDRIRYGEKCGHCNGRCYEIANEVGKIQALSASFNLFFSFACLPDKETTSRLPQLIRVSTVIGHNENRFFVGIGGEYSRAICKWLGSYPKNTDIEEMVSAMKSAWGKMMPYRSSRYEYGLMEASLPYGNGWLNIQCPGDRCGLNPLGGYVKDGEGYDFGDNNVDTTAQQITLLVSLAALHDKARKEM